MERSSEKFKIFLRDYWRYYRELEDEFLQTQKFVDFRQSNFGTYSAEYLKLFQAVCSEIDVIGKAMAAEVNSSFKPEDKKNNILKWWYQIQDKYTILEDYLKLDIPGMKLTEKTVSLLDDIPCIPWKGFRVEERVNGVRHRDGNVMRFTGRWG